MSQFLQDPYWHHIITAAFALPMIAGAVLSTSAEAGTQAKRIGGFFIAVILAGAGMGFILYIATYGTMQP